jgi:hypothetical protein
MDLSLASIPVVDKLRAATRERVGDDLDLDPGSAIDQATAPQEAIGGHVARARDLLSSPRAAAELSACRPASPRWRAASLWSWDRLLPEPG